MAVIFGTVADVRIHGNTSKPVAAKTNQLFSHRQPVIRLMGAAKLPLRMPPRTTTASPDTTFPLMGSPSLQPLDAVNQHRVSGENDPSPLHRSRKIIVRWRVDARFPTPCGCWLTNQHTRKMGVSLTDRGTFCRVTTLSKVQRCRGCHVDHQVH